MDRDVTRIAERQHGIITYAQARAAGMTPGAIRQCLRSGRWEAMAEGVYRVSGSPPTWEQRVIALTFAAGPSAAASHRSAAALLGIPGFDRRGVPEVTTPRSRRHRDPSTLVHRWRPCPDDHLTEVDGIVTTRVARTLVDLSGVVHPRRAERAVDNCLAARMVSLESLHRTFGELAGRGRKGTSAMRVILAERIADYVAPASELEARFLDMVRAAGLPEPVAQLDAGDDHGWIGRVDYAYPSVGALIELDSRRHHSAMLDRMSDADRDERLIGGGWRHVVRFSWDDVVDRADLVIDRLRALLALDDHPQPVTLSVALRP